MTMIHPVAIDPAVIQAGAASAEVAAVAHTSLVNDPKYYVLLNSIGVGTVAGTIFIKYWIYMWSNRLAKKYDSNVLYANALHHRADALSSIAALAGLCGRVGVRLLSHAVHRRSLAGPHRRSDGRLHHSEGGL